MKKKNDKFVQVFTLKMCSSYVSGDRGYSGDSSALTDYYEHESQTQTQSDQDHIMMQRL